MEDEIAPSSSTKPPADVIILDGAFIVQMLKPSNATTFQEYADNIFIPHVMSWLASASRIDIVWDRYTSDSLKNATRSKRGTGARRRVQFSTKIPGNWQGFLRVNENKMELFSLLAEKIQSITSEGKQVVTTFGESALCSPIQTDMQALIPCTHEEADTRMFIHVADAIHSGYKRIILRSCDSDVLVIAIACVQDLCLDELWIAFGSGKTFRYIPAHSIARTIGPEKSRALLAFHALTGCDIVSSFYGKGKKQHGGFGKNFRS